MTINTTNIKKTTGTCAENRKIEAETKQKGDFNGTTGERIRAHRVKLGLDQSSLADKVFMSRTTLCKLEKDKKKATSDELVCFSKLFKVTIDYLLCQTNVRSNINEYTKIAPLVEEDRLSEVNEFFLNQTILYKERYLSKFSQEKQEKLAKTVYNILSSQKQ
ncbi:MAG: helix-turn-helix transcriptional regulator [Paenibacillaceae bacterium]|nr:helix-turn-helix transcriptional regulator [Paenibacillaceae bacterium]